MKRIVFICMGNICRSPLAEGVFRQRLAAAGLGDTVAIDSAGTHGYQLGQAPDPRAQRVGADLGVDISDLRARLVEAADFGHGHWLLGMDRNNIAEIERLRQLHDPDGATRIDLLLSFTGNGQDDELADPYYGDEAGFDRMAERLLPAIDGLVAQWRQMRGRGV